MSRSWIPGRLRVLHEYTTPLWPRLPHNEPKVPLVRWNVLPSDGIQDLFLLEDVEPDPTPLIHLGLASPHRAERGLFVGCVGSLEPGKGSGVGFPFP